MSKTLPVSPVRILVLNGPNLNMLGKREPEVYGSEGLDDVMSGLASFGESIGAEVKAAQYNGEGALVDALHDAHQWATGVILNAGGYSHTSVALRDAVSSIDLPVVEVHISNIAAREEFRRESLLSAVCAGVVFGFGHRGYRLALQAFV